MVAEGRVALRSGALDDAIAVLQAALDMAERTDSQGVRARDQRPARDGVQAQRPVRGGARPPRAARRPVPRDVHPRRRPAAAHAAGGPRHEGRPPAGRDLPAAHRRSSRRWWASTPTPARGRRPWRRTTSRRSSSSPILTEFRDAETGEHTNRVGDMAAEIAHAMGHAPEWCELLRLAARLHDVGKVAVPDSVLRKTGPLTVEEYEMMKSHTSMGHRILAGNSAPMFQMAAEIAQSHHEWWDGSGYPLGIAAHLDRGGRPDRQRRRRVRRAVQQASVQAGVGARRGGALRDLGSRRPVRPGHRRCVRRRAHRPPPRAGRRDPLTACAQRSARPTQPATKSASSLGRHVDAACPPGVAVRRHGAEHAERQHVRVGVDDVAGALRLAEQRGDVVEVHLAAGAQRVGDGGVGPLDVDEGEVRGVLGHEHARSPRCPAGAG